MVNHRPLPRPTSRPGAAQTARALGFVGLVLLLASPALAATEVRQLDARHAIDGQRLVFVDLPIGDLDVEVVPGDVLEIDASIRCSRYSRRCRERAEAITLAVDARPRAFEVHFDGFPKHNIGGGPSIDVVVRMPANLDLELDMGVGDVDVVGLDADVDIDLGVGDVEVRMAEATVGAVYLDVGVGSADLDPTPPSRDRSGFLFLGNELSWDDGPGRAEIEIDVGVGEANVRLE